MVYFHNLFFLNDYQKLSQELSPDQAFSRVLWLPRKPSLGYSSVEHPSVDGLRLSRKRPFLSSSSGPYEIFNYLYKSSYIGELLDIAGIRYIIYPPLDFKNPNLSDDDKKYYNFFLDKLSRMQYVKDMKTFGAVPQLETRKYQQKFFIPLNSWLIIGSDNIYAEATKSAAQRLADNALIFGEETPGLSERLLIYPEIKIILNNKTLIDLAASLVPEENMIFPAKDLNYDPDDSGWWKREAKDLISWREFLQTKYDLDNQDFDFGGGWAVAERDQKLNIKNQKIKTGDILLVRVIESSQSGSIKFSQNGKVIRQIQTLDTKDPNVRWFEVGRLLDNGQIELNTEGKINVVNALAVVDEESWFDYQTTVKQLEQAKRVLPYESIVPKVSPKVSYQQINPTQYKVTIQGLVEPALLVFSENYDPLWKMGENRPIKVYSFLNGFRIEKDGVYTIEYEPQKYVIPGLVISGLGFLALLGFWKFYQKRL